MKNPFLALTLLLAAFGGTARADEAAIRQSLQKLGLQQFEIKPSPLAGTKTVLSESGVLYITDDGKQFIQGPLYDISGAHPVNATNQLLAEKMDALSKEMIVYKAPKEQDVITVFTDTTCGYCRTLHQQLADYNALGITVRYLAFPREGLNGPVEKQMKNVWCAADPKKAFDDAMKGKNVPSVATCHIDLAAHYQLGVLYGVQGTPAIVLPDGMVIPGYQAPQPLKQILDARKNGG